MTLWIVFWIFLSAGGFQGCGFRFQEKQRLRWSLYSMPGRSQVLVHHQTNSGFGFHDFIYIMCGWKKLNLQPLKAIWLWLNLNVLVFFLSKLLMLWTQKRADLCLLQTHIQTPGIMFTTAELTVTQLHGFGFLAMCQFATSLHHVASDQDNTQLCHHCWAKWGYCWTEYVQLSRDLGWNGHGHCKFRSSVGMGLWWEDGVSGAYVQIVWEDSA